MNNELFDDLPLPDLDSLQPDEIKSAWPVALADMLDVSVAACKRAGESEARALELAIATLDALSRYMGGRQYYLPTSDALDRALRDNKMWRDYSGRTEDIERFAAQYRLTPIAVYRILAEQRAIHTRKRQGRLAI